MKTINQAAVTALLLFGVAAAWSQGDHGSMQGGSPPPEAATAPSMARDPHAYSGGHTRPAERPLVLMDEHSMGLLRFDRLEAVRRDGETTGAYEVQYQYGRDYDKAVLRAEGHVADGKVEEAGTELLWGHAVAAYWDTRLGVRNDRGEGRPDRNWLAFGVGGLAPYWFEVDATAYLGEDGRSALRFETEYELLVTQKLVLQPRFEASFFGKRDDELALGKGLAEGVLGLRLRYEIRREFAPYIGVERAMKFGTTADLVEAAGGESAETHWVAGLRFWF